MHKQRERAREQMTCGNEAWNLEGDGVYWRLKPPKGKVCVEKRLVDAGSVSLFGLELHRPPVIVFSGFTF